MSELLPRDWISARLGEITEINARSLPANTPDDLEFRYFDVASASATNDEAEGDLSGWVRFGNAPSRARRLAQEGDVIYATVRPLLRRLMLGTGDPHNVYSTGFAVLSPNRDVLDGAFLLQLMTAEYVERQVFARLTGTGYPAINAEDLSELYLSLPPISEQKRIAALLDAWDQAISATGKLIAAKREHFRQTTKRLVWSDSDDWQPLSAYMEPSRDRVGQGRSLEVYSVTREGLKPQLEHFSKRIANEDISRHMLLRPGEFALSGLNFWLGSVAVSDLNNDVCISPDYKVFRIKKTASADYFKHLVRTDNFRELLVTCSTERASVVRRNFNRALFLESEIPVPSLAEQKSRAMALGAVAAEVEATEGYYSLLLSQKRGLMQKLLTGELQLDERFDLPSKGKAVTVGGTG